MPHDRNGHLVTEGALVTIPCRVISVGAGEEFHNCTVETLEPMYPGEQKTSLALNTQQVELVIESTDEPATESTDEPAPESAAEPAAATVAAEGGE